MTYSFVEEEEGAPKADTFQDKALQYGKDQVRTVARLGARGAEVAAGIPGDVLSLIHNFIGAPLAEAVFKEKPVPYEDTTIGKFVPTTTKNRENLRRLINSDYLEPQNEVERFGDEVWTDAVSLLLPSGKGKIPFKNTFSKAIGKSLGANAVGEEVKDLSKDESKGGYAKFGTLFLLTLLDKTKAGRYIGELYKSAEESLPKDASINATHLKDSLTELKTKMSTGTLAPSEKFIVDEADAILNKIKSDKISPQEAWAAKRSLNEKLEKVLYETPQKAGQARARKFANKIVRDLNETLDDYGKENPEFLEKFRAAEEGFSTIGKSNFISRFVEKNLKYGPVTAGLVHLFHGPIGGAAATAVLPYQALKLSYRISKSPTLRKYYSEVLQSAAKEDALVFNKSVEKLDKALQKEEESDTYELID